MCISNDWLNADWPAVSVNQIGYCEKNVHEHFLPPNVGTINRASCSSLPNVFFIEWFTVDPGI